MIFRTFINNKFNFKKSNNKKNFYIGLFSFLIICIINIIMYKYLPSTLHLNSFGDKIPIKKELFLLFVPCISIIGNYLKLRLNYGTDFSIICFNIILPIASILCNLYSK